MSSSTVWWYSLASGALFLSQLISELWWLLFIGIYAVLVLLVESQRSPYYYLMWWGLGTLKMLAALWWVPTLYPLSWLGLEEGLRQLLLVYGFWLVNALVIGAALIILGWLFRRLYRHTTSAIWFFPFLWVTHEVIGSILFSFWSLGPGGGIHSDFSFGYSGYVLLETNLFNGVVAFGGVWLASFTVAALATSVYVYFNQLTSRRVGLVIVLLICLLIGYSHYSYTKRIPQQLDVSVIAINTAFAAKDLRTQSGRTAKFEATKAAVLAAAAHNPDIIVLPEDARLVAGFASPRELLTWLQELDPDLLLYDSARVALESGGVTLRAYVFDTKDHAVYLTDKQYLVPQGEFLPYLSHALSKLFAPDTLLTQMERNQAYRPGPVTGYGEFRSDAPGILFCFESVKPDGATEVRTQHDYPLLVHLVSHAWFHEPYSLWRSLDRMVKAQALFSNSTIVQASNMSRPAPVVLNTGQALRGEVLKSTDTWELVWYEL